MHPVTISPTRPQARGGREREADDGQQSGRDEALVKRPHDGLVGPKLDEIGAGDGCDDARRADRERIQHCAVKDGLTNEKYSSKDHGGDDGDGVGLEQIRRHTGAVANVVADIVSDGRRIARIVLRNAGLDLADEIGADIGALGEDAAAKTREDRYQGGAEAEGDKRIDRLAAIRRIAKQPRQNKKIASDAEQRQTGDEHPCDCARLE
jgi:hypothetical protein